MPKLAMEAIRRRQRIAATIDARHGDGFTNTIIAGAYATSRSVEPRG